MGASAAYEETYRRYLARPQVVDPTAVQATLGIEATPEAAVVSFCGEPYRVGPSGVSGPDGKRPHLSVCVVLCNYLLRCPGSAPASAGWVAFREFRDAAPLIASFANTVEGALARAFAGRLDALRRAAEALGARPPVERFPYDFAACIPALPRVPMLLLFNDTDQEFPAACNVLFERGAADYLDTECLAMLGMQLARRLEQERR